MLRQVQDVLPVGGVGGPRTIMWSHAAGTGRLELVQGSDGQLAILQGGEPLRGLAWRPQDVEACVRTYLKLMKQARRAPAADA